MAHDKDVELMKYYYGSKYQPYFPSAGRREQHSVSDDGQPWIEEEEEEEEEEDDDCGDDLSWFAVSDTERELLQAGSELDSFYNLSDQWQAPRSDWPDFSVNQP